ncbi:ubiquitin conjugating enzyme E2 [Ramicandelaber brevisporus]|nr:ubiquitin conjugating enzyme E2 [Ramicandelaber brevisporus]
MAAARRIQRELSLINAAPNADITVITTDTDLYKWKALIRGPAGSPYRAGIFTLNIDYPLEFPFKPPKIAFGHKVYHPNVDESGAICLDALKSDGWKPSLQIKAILQQIWELLQKPNPDDPLNADIANQYVNNRPAFEQTAEKWTAQFAGKA